MPPNPRMTAPAGNALKPFCDEQAIRTRPSILSNVPAWMQTYLLTCLQSLGATEGQQTVNVINVSVISVI